METKLILYILAIVGAAIVIFFLYKKRQSIDANAGIMGALDNLGIPKHEANFQHETVTPGGVKVKSTVPVPSIALDKIDEGITNQLVRHTEKYPHWYNYKTLADYSVLFVEPRTFTVENDPGAPALIIGQNIMTAGTAIGAKKNAARLTHLVIPHQAKSNWSHLEYLMNTAWNESEHVRESQNDLQIFAEYIGAGDVHPHVP